MPEGEGCPSGNEVQVSTSVAGPVRHLCGVHTGLLFNKYMTNTQSYIRLNLISYEHLSAAENNNNAFELQYIGKYV